MAEFEVRGPFEVNFEDKPGGRTINEYAFWEKSYVKDLKNRFGIYIFIIKKSGGTDCYVPYYVGKTTRGFSKEVFSSHKMKNYYEILHEIKKGTPYMFFLVHPNKNLPKQPLPQTSSISEEINQIEKYLIEIGFQINTHIMNKL